MCKPNTELEIDWFTNHAVKIEALKAIWVLNGQGEKRVICFNKSQSKEASAEVARGLHKFIESNLETAGFCFNKILVELNIEPIRNDNDSTLDNDSVGWSVVNTTNELSAGCFGLFDGSLPSGVTTIPTGATDRREFWNKHKCEYMKKARIQIRERMEILRLNLNKGVSLI